MASPTRSSWLNLRTVIVLATAAGAAACAASSPPPHSLQQVSSVNPSVTFAYSGDEELLHAEQKAVTFCSQYNSTPQAPRITSNPSGPTKDVVFECAPNPPTAAGQPTTAPNLTYTYRTDQELLEASRTADGYCTSNGQRAVSNITAHTDGSKTVVFRCTPA
jgi:hypothetical protein